MAAKRNAAVRQHNRDVMRQALNIKGVSYKLNCSEKTSRALIERGQLRGFKVGTEYRVLPEDLEAYIQSQLVAS